MCPPKKEKIYFLKKLSVKNSASSGIVGNSQIQSCLIKISTQSLKGWAKEKKVTF